MAISHWRIKDRYYRLIGTRCSECGYEHFPPMYTCKKCGSSKIKDRELPREGEVETFTALYEPMRGFDSQVPLLFAIVKLSNGVKILGQLVDCAPDAVNIGDRVSVVFRKVREEGDSGQILYGYKFRKVTEPRG